MRVVLAGPYPADPDRPSGGVEAAFVNLVDGLEALGDLELHVVTFQAGQEPAAGRTPVHRLPIRARFNNLELYRTARRALARTLRGLEPDVVHAQDSLGYGFTCLKAAEAPVVVSIHGIVRETRKSVRGMGARLQVALAGVTVERYCVRHAEYLVQPTRYPERYFGAEIRGQIDEVGNPIRDALFELEPAPEPGRILVAGAVTEGKRTLDVVEALAQVRDVVTEARLRVAGPALDPLYASRLTERARELGLVERVELLGPLSQSGMLDEYRRAAVVVLASSQETSPMVLAEAMAAGVPVVATRVGGVPELLADGDAGVLFEPGDVGALAGGIARVLGDDREHRRLADEARSAVLPFRPAAVARRVRDVYTRAAAGSGPGAP